MTKLFLAFVGIGLLLFCGYQLFHTSSSALLEGIGMGIATILILAAIMPDWYRRT